LPDYETQLIDKAVQSGGIEQLIAHGVREDHFDNDDNKKIWEYLTGYVRKYRTPPSLDTVKERFPEHKWKIVSEPLQAVQDGFIVGVKRKEAVKAFGDLADILEDNQPENIAIIDELFLDKAKQLAQVVPASHISKFTQMSKRIDEYKVKKDAGITFGIPFGIEALDDKTMGLHPHQYATIAGWTGIGKSTLGLVLSLNHFVAGFTPMIISLEMDEGEIYRKLDAIAVGLKQQYLKAMTLPGADVKKWEEYAAKIETFENDIIVVDVDFATPDKVYAETARWNPDVVVVDYVQLMVGPKNLRSKWEKVDHCSQMLKAQARSLRIPVYGLSQTNADGADQGAKLDNLGGAKAIGFHSDLVLGLNRTEEMEAMNKMQVRIIKNRGGPTGSFDMYWNQEDAEFREWKGSDVYISQGYKV
jgi:replicative DNA helicase